MIRIIMTISVLIYTQSYASTIIMSHRGGMGHFSQSSTAALHYSIELGIPFIELDLRFSRDHVPVVHHDEDIDPDFCIWKDGRQIEENLAISSLNLEQIKAIQCGMQANPKFPDQIPAAGSEILTLQEVFTYVNSLDNNMKFMLELKRIKGRKHKEFIEKVLTVIADNAMASRVNLQSAALTYRAYIRKAVARMNIQLINNIVPIPEKWAKASTIRILHRYRKLVIVYTVNSPENWDKLLARGVDGFITDYPRQLQEHIRAKETGERAFLANRVVAAWGWEL